MKIIDKYIIKKYLSTFFFMLGLFCIVVMAIDFSEQMEDLTESSASVWVIVTKYYGNLIFYYANLLSSLLIFLTVIWVTSNMAQKSELIAILNGGVSYKRMLFPFLGGAGILVVLSLAVGHFLLPRANADRLEFEVEHILSHFKIEDKNLHRELATDTIYYFEKITANRNIGYNLSIEYWDTQGGLSKKLFASKARYKEEDQLWQLTNVQVRTFNTDHSEMVDIVEKQDTIMPLRITDFGERSQFVSTMDYFQLNNYIAEGEEKGSPKVVHWRMEKYLRTSNAFAIFILTLIAFSLSSRKTRGGLGVHLALAIVIGFIYVFVSRVSTVAATNSGLDPLIAAWLPNSLFLLLGIYLYRKAPK